MALNFISEHIGSLQYLLVATPTTIVSLSMYAPKVAAIRCHVCVLAATPSTIGDFCPASLQGCRQPSTVCKTAKPSFWRLAVCRNTSLFRILASHSMFSLLGGCPATVTDWVPLFALAKNYWHK